MNIRTASLLRTALLVLLVLWGGFTVFRYIGVPVHLQVLLSDAARPDVQTACPTNGTMCLAMHAFFPSFMHAIARLAPLLGYIILSAVVVGGLYFFATSRSNRTLSVRPLGVLAVFVAMLWLMFTTLSLGGTAGNSYRLLYEPLPQVYVNADQETLLSLQQNFADLQSRGCLTQTGTTNHGAGIFNVKVSCIQMSFITRVMTQFAMIFVLLLHMLVVGRMVLRRMKLSLSQHPLAELAMQLGIGTGVLITVLWALAVAGLYTQLVGWVLLLLPFVIGYKEVLRLWQWSKEERGSIDIERPRFDILLWWLLLSLLALNFLNVVRPFPIGWDDLGRYLNQPRLLVSYGEAVPSMGTFQWEYVTSLGFLLFGYNSVFGATLSMLINWMAGLLAITVIAGFAMAYLGKGRGALTALLYYAMPLVGHFSFADMKTDNAVFAMGALGFMSMCFALLPRHPENGEGDEYDVSQRTKLVALAGVFGGLAFGFKATSIMLVTATAALLGGVLVHWSAAVGAVMLAGSLYIKQAVLNLPDVSQRLFGNPNVLSPTTMLMVCALGGLLLIGYALWLHHDKRREGLKLAGVFLAGVFVTVAPWILRNNIINRDFRIVLSPPNLVSPTMVIFGEDPSVYVGKTRVLPPDLVVNRDACMGSSKTEELDRYWGYGTGWSHYLGLPFRSVMNLDSAGYYVTTYPALLLFPLVLLLPVFWDKRRRWLRWLTAATALLIVQWMVLANGIPWYGVGMFLGLCVILESFIALAPDRATRWTAGTLITLSLLLCLSQRMWQFEMQQNIFDYAFGKISANAMEQRTIPHYATIRDMVLQRAATMPETPFAFRMGTFIPYFIPRNLEILPVADNQLELFNCLNQERDGALTVRRLKALGFNSMIFDTNTATIESDPNGTLHKKVEAFVNFVNDPATGVQIVVNDPDNGIAFMLLP